MNINLDNYMESDIYVFRDMRSCQFTRHPKVLNWYKDMDIPEMFVSVILLIVLYQSVLSKYKVRSSGRLKFLE